MIIYHHTSMTHMPYIIADAELVGSPPNGLWPADFVWATTDARGDRTTGCCKPGQRLPRVRIKMDAEAAGFVPWLDAVNDRTDWDVTLTQRLIVSAQQVEQPHTEWYATMGPVGMDAVLDIEMKTWDGPWKPFDMHDVAELPAQWIGFTAGEHRWRVTRKWLNDKGASRLHYMADDLGRVDIED